MSILAPNIPHLHNNKNNKNFPEKMGSVIVVLLLHNNFMQKIKVT